MITSADDAADDTTAKVSVDSITIFCSPPTRTTDEPCVISTSFTKYTVLVAEVSVNLTLTDIFCAATFATLTPIIVVVVAAGTEYTVVFVVPIEPVILFLNTFAIYILFYPKAIAYAKDVSSTSTPSTKYPPAVRFTEPVIITEPLIDNRLFTIRLSNDACCTSIVPLKEPVNEPVNEPLKSAKAKFLSCEIEPENMGLCITILPAYFCYRYKYKRIRLLRFNWPVDIKRVYLV